MSNIRTCARNITSQFKHAVLKLFGLTPEWSDVRPAHISVGLARIAIFSAMLWIHTVLVAALLDGDIAGFVAQRTAGAYFPAGLLLFFGSYPPAAILFEVARWVSLTASIMAIIGLVTRPAMILSLVSTMLLALLDLSRYEFWSHPYHPVFLAAIPFVFVQAGSALSLDRWLNERYGWIFGRRTEPVFWGVLAAQYAVALFYFGAFWAKMFVSHWGIDYVFSDNMRNILAVTWSGYMEYPIPWYIQTIAGVPLIWMAVAAIHLVMQALPIGVIFGVNRPWLRFIEGVNYAVGAIGLRVFMSVSNPWWLLLTALFIDWDHYLYRFKHLKIAAVSFSAPLIGRRAVTLYLAVFFSVYIAAFITQKSNGWRLYPMDQLNMYAAVYATAPIRGHMPYAHILRGNLSIQLPDGQPATLEQKDRRWIRVDNLSATTRQILMPTISRKWTIHDPILYRINGTRLSFPSIPDIFHLNSRLTDLDEIEAGLREFVSFAAPMPQFPAGSVLVIRRQDVAFQPYPHQLSDREVLHEGAKGVLSLTNGRFAGVVAKYDAGTIGMQTKGDVKIKEVLWRPMYPEGIKAIEPSKLAGSWTAPKSFKIDEEVLKGLPKGYVNILLRAETPFGTFDFDGPYFNR